MKRVISLIAAVIFTTLSYSQGVTINFRDGSTMKFSMSSIESILFDEDADYDKYVSVYLERGGTLSSIISKSQASELLKLKISGHMDARDFDYIKWDCMKVEEIDLSDVVIDSYTGTEGTEEGVNKNYAANEIPSGSFFYWKNVHKYVYDGMPIDEGMPSLKKIVLPQGIKAIRRNAFARAYNLTEINIPEGVESIDYVAFAICTSMEEMKLPSSLKTVGESAFAGMTNIKRFYTGATSPPSALSNSFNGIPNEAILYVPNGTENLYRNAEGWKHFTQIVGMGNLNGDDNENELPKGYTRISYVQSTGSQSIDTGIYPCQDTKIETKFVVVEKTFWGGIICAKDYQHNYGISQHEYHDNFFVEYDNSIYIDDKNTLLAEYTKGVECNITLDRNKLYVNNYYIGEITGASPNFTCSKTLNLFWNNSSHVASGYSKIKMYYAKIFENGVLLRNYIPCKNEYGVVGFYETVLGEFKPSDTSVPFVSGTENGDEAEEAGDISSIIGVWECVDADYGEWGEHLEGDTNVGDFLYIYADHTYKVDGKHHDSGKWSQNGKLFETKSDESNSLPVTYTITQLTPSAFTIVLSENFAQIKLTFHKIR